MIKSYAIDRGMFLDVICECDRKHVLWADQLESIIKLINIQCDCGRRFISQETYDIYITLNSSNRAYIRPLDFLDEICGHLRNDALLKNI